MIHLWEQVHVLIVEWTMKVSSFSHGSSTMYLIHHCYNELSMVSIFKAHILLQLLKIDNVMTYHWNKITTFHYGLLDLLGTVPWTFNTIWAQLPVVLLRWRFHFYWHQIQQYLLFSSVEWITMKMLGRIVTCFNHCRSILHYTQCHELPERIARDNLMKTYT